MMQVLPAARSGRAPRIRSTSSDQVHLLRLCETAAALASGPPEQKRKTVRIVKEVGWLRNSVDDATFFNSGRDYCTSVTHPRQVTNEVRARDGAINIGNDENVPEIKEEEPRNHRPSAASVRE